MTYRNKGNLWKESCKFELFQMCVPPFAMTIAHIGYAKIRKRHDKLQKKSPDYIHFDFLSRKPVKQRVLHSYILLQVMVAEALDIARETYFAIVLDRTHAGPVMVGSRHGGMDIEETAEKDPDSIVKVSTHC